MPGRPPGTRRFVCAGCGSQWFPGLGWTPADADGTVAPEVTAAVEAADGYAERVDGEAANPVTSDPNGAGAGNADT